MHRWKPVLLLLALHWLGCASLEPSARVPQARVYPPPIVNPDTAARVHFVRNNSFAASAAYFWVMLDERVVAGLLTLQRTEIMIEPGAHTVGVACYGGWSSDWEISKLEIRPSPKEQLAFRLSPAWSSCAEIEPLALPELPEWQERTTPVLPGTKRGR